MAYRALWQAVQNGQVDTAKRLISEPGFNLHVTDTKQNTPLHLAAVLGQLPIVKLLLSKGAEVDRRALGGVTPLYAAVQSNNVAVAR